MQEHWRRVLTGCLVLLVCVPSLAIHIADSHGSQELAGADIEAAALEGLASSADPNNVVNSKDSELADDGNQGGLSRRLSDKKSHVTVIANTNKLFQVETADGTTISQSREGGQTVDGQDEATLRKDLDERRGKRDRRDREAQRRDIARRADEADKNSEPANDQYSLSGMCALAVRQCPLNWEYRGTVGLLFADDTYDKANPFKTQEAGANPDVGYKWAHPNLCCAVSKKADIRELYVLSKSCPDGNTDRLSGVTYLAAKYSQNPYQVEEGHDYNKFWKWIHPYICQMTKGDADFRTKHRSCLLARSCAGEFKDFGFTGLLVRKQDADKQPFQLSDETEFKEYPGWRWIHPKLCCNPDGV